MAKKEYEYVEFGDGYLRRQDRRNPVQEDDEWEPVPNDDVGIAKEWLKAKEQGDRDKISELINTPFARIIPKDSESE